MQVSTAQTSLRQPHQKEGLCLLQVRVRTCISTEELSVYGAIGWPRLLLYLLFTYQWEIDGQRLTFFYHRKALSNIRIDDGVQLNAHSWSAGSNICRWSVNYFVVNEMFVQDVVHQCNFRRIFGYRKY